MKRSTFDGLPANQPSASIIVRHSTIHGNGVFAKRKIAADTCVIEYTGDRVTARQAASRQGADPDNPFHTFFFSLETGRLIDGASNGNDARWINHCCEPNCEAREEDGRIFIYTLRDISRGEELNYDYGLIVTERHTAALKRSYACLCGAATCRNTMLAPKRKSRQKQA
ncbi:MAG: SET domain-containing protein-lysine N-methyltransferase [Burkholderiales bacterium RIFCSPLOWO2_02_FULL_57_36]|nr:MAG: SET domain-containing protein-lysine N-methyltransferase [Burkholderiales bacterium RIFCSPLOWO2_02_FULL_57_36]